MLEAEIQPRQVAHGGGLLLGDRKVVDVGGDLFRPQVRQALVFDAQRQPFQQPAEGQFPAFDQGQLAGLGGGLGGDIDGDVADLENVHRLGRPRHGGGNGEQGRQASQYKVAD